MINSQMGDDLVIDAILHGVTAQNSAALAPNA
jgi:hypothetical protein